MTDLVGQQLGNYRFLRLLGTGGFAGVYLGEHIHLGTQAAIKVMHTQLTSEDVDKFRMEARTIAHLEHPHIVRVLDFGVAENIPFLVMDYASNGSLRQCHPRGSLLPLATVVSYVKQIARALQYAHDQKLIHRDIKPENMLLGRNNEILLSDFGIAITAQTSRHQNAQDLAGTIAYMAPEQIQAYPRPASDQYALGIVVYEWLLGHRPFHGSYSEIAMKHIIVPPPSLCEQLPTLSPTVEQVVMTALAKDPQARFPSVQAFADALEAAAASDFATPKAQPSHRTSGIPSSMSTIPMTPTTFAPKIDSHPIYTQPSQRAEALTPIARLRYDPRMRLMIFIFIFLFLGSGAFYYFTRSNTTSSANTSAPPSSSSSSPCLNLVSQLTDTSSVSSFVTIPHTYSQVPPMSINTTKVYCAGINTNRGLIVLELDPQLAPNTVNNFVFLAQHHFYDGLTFHRVIPNFIIQAGDPVGNGTGGPGYTFNDEPVKDNYTAGAIAMANSGPNSNGSQFFICTADNSQLLAKNYNLFGHVVQGLAIAQSIQGPGDDTASKNITPDTITHLIVIVAS